MHLHLIGKTSLHNLQFPGLSVFHLLLHVILEFQYLEKALSCLAKLMVLESSLTIMDFVANSKV